MSVMQGSLLSVPWRAKAAPEPAGSDNACTRGQIVTFLYWDMKQHQNRHHKHKRRGVKPLLFFKAGSISLRYESRSPRRWI